MNHETDENVLFILQACRHFENIAPAGISLEVVIGEVEAADAVPAYGSREWRQPASQ